MAWAQAPVPGGTLRVSSGGDPPDFDLHQTTTYLTQHVGAPCYSTLMRVDPANPTQLLPDLAEKFEVSDDGLTVTFTLRQGVKFHDGTDLTVDDVIYSLNRVKAPPSGIVSPRRGLLGNIATIEPVGAAGLKITLSQPQPDFPLLVSNPFNVIYPKAVVEPLDAEGVGMKRKIVGTGAFKLGRSIDGQLYELERNEAYFGTPAHLDKIQFFPIRGEIERGVALQGERIDACFLFASEAVLTTLREAPGVTALRRPTPTFINLIPNVTQKPFDDVRVREALSLAIDRSAFIATVGPLAGAFYHSYGLLLPGSDYQLSTDEIREFAGYDTLPDAGGDIEANRARARELLKEAGVPEGFKVSLLARGDLPAFRDSSINVASQLNAIGFDASVDVRDAGAFATAENRGEFQLVVHSVAVSGSLPDQILGEGYTSFGGRNYGKWEDPSLDDLYRAQSREPDVEKRKALIRDFQLAFMKTFYHINLAWVGYGAAHSDRVKGWSALPDIYTNMQLDNVYLEG
ncbi:ABC transporter substrate-binding protein [Mesorhizobium sp. CAU 1741]|uniref:ABC transporter substrate-binding protein n=1 Tax=Mesorhizobium sp. CAU 1741 TaxID=3140366 RepID=UPI00325B3D73